MYAYFIIYVHVIIDFAVTCCLVGICKLIVNRTPYAISDKRIQLLCMSYGLIATIVRSHDAFEGSLYAVSGLVGQLIILGALAGLVCSLFWIPIFDKHFEKSQNRHIFTQEIIDGE